jgi:hypothetical protein
VYGEEKKYFVLGLLEQPRQDKNLLYRLEEPNESIKEGPLSFELFESPFASVSTDLSALCKSNEPSHFDFPQDLLLC